jgi:hypothetical protein
MEAHRLAEERSLELHRVVSRMLEEDPTRIRHARERVAGWLREGSVSALYAQAWADLLDGPFDKLREMLLSESEEARALRQCTPFAGVVDPRTRWKIWADVRARRSDAS